MNSDQSRPVVVLRQGRDVSLRRRHPWVFSGAIVERRGSLSPGCLVDVVSRDGKFLGCGHWGTRSIAVRVLSFEPVINEEELIALRIDSAIRYRQTIDLITPAAPRASHRPIHGSPHSPKNGEAGDAGRGGYGPTTGFRLVHAEGDGLPGLIIDVYGDTAVVQCHSAGMWRLRDCIQATLLARSELKVSTVVFRLVEAQVEDQVGAAPPAPSKAAGGGATTKEGGVPELESGGGEFGSDSPGGDERVVSFLENGLRFLVNVESGQKTGFFLDQRHSRMRVREFAQGRRVLNAFSYTGAFSVYALAGGAESVCSVDASRPAIDLCRQNVVLNFAQAAHSSEVADCFQYLAQIPDTFDLIILDPPAFAKHQRAIQRALRGYETINELALKRIRPGGVLCTFSCSQLVQREMFRESVQRAASSAGRVVRVIENFHQASCHPVNIYHPEGEYLKGFALAVE